MIAPIAYDPSYEGLLRPQSRRPLPMDAEWLAHEDAIAAEFSRLAYFRFERPGDAAAAVAAAIAQVGFGAPAWFWDRSAGADRDRFDAQAFAVASADLAIVAFRGTQPDSTDDVFTDAAAKLTAWPGAGRVHWGFWGSLQTILPDIGAWLATVRAPTLIITGHSLGAAMATLLAGLHDRARLVNFGSPRVGNAAFAASFARDRVRRYVDCTDGVTSFPRTALYTGTSPAFDISTRTARSSRTSRAGRRWSGTRQRRSTTMPRSRAASWPIRRCGPGRSCSDQLCFGGSRCEDRPVMDTGAISGGG